jgi:hypothetical protein
MDSSNCDKIDPQLEDRASGGLVNLTRARLPTRGANRHAPTLRNESGRSAYDLAALWKSSSGRLMDSNKENPPELRIVHELPGKILFS